ncbi:MAG: hypothetical protein KKC85_19845 [Gammaproteobacteria bacterium]|nr:hypothetical protein [Gammaproteobacteria bacterium]MBU1441340.1 hypothetical protein [Gammaproteobacteria bacterium]MBU2288662.1 hypothetical protein [Gammaproteobacteria bacterium]
MTQLLNFIRGRQQASKSDVAGPRGPDASAEPQILLNATAYDPVERLMRKIDYYMHCELDEQYDHERPTSARRQLIDELRREFNARDALSGRGAHAQFA